MYMLWHRKLMSHHFSFTERLVTNFILKLPTGSGSWWLCWQRVSGGRAMTAAYRQGERGGAGVSRERCEGGIRASSVVVRLSLLSLEEKHNKNNSFVFFILFHCCIYVLPSLCLLPCFPKWTGSSVAESEEHHLPSLDILILQIGRRGRTCPGKIYSWLMGLFSTKPSCFGWQHIGHHEFQW